MPGAETAGTGVGATVGAGVIRTMFGPPAGAGVIGTALLLS